MGGSSRPSIQVLSTDTGFDRPCGMNPYTDYDTGDSLLGIDEAPLGGS